MYRCHPDVRLVLHQALCQKQVQTGNLCAFYAYGPIDSFQNLPGLHIPDDVVDGDYEWKWTQDVTHPRTICPPTIAEVAPTTQIRSTARIVTLLGPATPVIVYCPEDSEYIKPGKPVWARSRVNLWNHLLRASHGTLTRF